MNGYAKSHTIVVAHQLVQVEPAPILVFLLFAGNAYIIKHFGNSDFHMKLIFLFILNIIVVYAVFYVLENGYKIIKNYFTKKHADNRPFIKYLVDFKAKIKVGDLVKSDAPNFKMKEVMVVLEENVYGPDFSGVISPGFVVLYDNKKTFIAEHDCYKVTISN